MARFCSRLILVGTVLVMSQTTFATPSPGKIKNIIFDLGGVILDVDIQRSIKAFRKLQPDMADNALFHAYHGFEKGDFTPTSFRRKVREELKLSAEITDKQIDNAWNSILGNVPPEKVNAIQRYRQQGYRVFLLSNTNAIHLDKIHEIFREDCAQLQFANNSPVLEQVFEKLYYSFDMRKSKPDPAIYQQVLDEQNLIAEETLFLDDKQENLDGASSVGINTLLVEKQPFFDTLPHKLS